MFGMVVKSYARTKVDDSIWTKGRCESTLLEEMRIIHVITMIVIIFIVIIIMAVKEIITVMACCVEDSDKGGGIYRTCNSK